MHSARTRFARRVAAVVVAIAALAGAVPGTAAAIDRPATPSTFRSVFSNAGAGDTVLLATGNYGTFGGASKPGVVTIRTQPGANAKMDIDFDGASNITIDGLTLDEIAMEGGETKHITIRNSEITGQTVLRTGSLANADILFDNNHHGAWNKCGNCGEGRVFLPEKTGQPSGITIQNSRFGPGGNSDGIQNGSNGTLILNNEFVGIKQIDGDDVHADSIQLYGSERTLIQGNWFHDVSVGIMCADGCDHETIQDNIFAVNGSPYSMTFLSDNGSQIVHNTFLDYRLCDYDTACGVLYLGNKSADPPSRGTIVKDNILTKICVCDGSVSGLAQEDFNLLRSGGSGANDVRSAPTYTGGANPSTPAGFTLAAGSPGKGTASDGSDRGARIGGAGPISAPPARTTPTAGKVGVRVLSSLGGVVKTGRLRVEVTVPSAGRLTATVRVRPGRARRGRRAPSRALVRLSAVRLGRVATGKHQVTAQVSRPVRRRLANARDAGVSVRVTIGSKTVTIGKLKLRR